MGTYMDMGGYIMPSQTLYKYRSMTCIHKGTVLHYSIYTLYTIILYENIYRHLIYVSIYAYSNLAK